MSKSFTVEEYRQPWESDEHWELRKEFLERYQNDFPEERLLCLAQVYTNMELLCCSYPEALEQTVRELAANLSLARELKGSRMAGNSINFVRGEGNSEKNINPPLKQKFVQFVPASSESPSKKLKSYEPEADVTSAVQQEAQGKPSSEHFQQTEETDVTKNADDQNLTTANSISDAEVQRSFQQMNAVVRRQIGRNQNCINVLHNACQKFKMIVTYCFTVSGSEPNVVHTCVVKINGVYVAEDISRNKEEARRRAAQKALEMLMSPHMCVTESNGQLRLSQGTVPNIGYIAVNAQVQSAENGGSKKKKKKEKKRAAQMAMSAPAVHPLVQTSLPSKQDAENTSGVRIVYLGENELQFSLPEFILLDNIDFRHTENNCCFLTESANFCHVPLLFNSAVDGSVHSCEIVLAGKSICKAVGPGKQEVKQAAAGAVINFMKRKFYTIKVKDERGTRDGIVISRRQLMGASAEKSLSDDNVGCKMLKMMGWSGGSIGKDGSSGIVEPIKADTSHGKGKGLGFSSQQNQHMDFLTKLDTILRDYANMNTTSDLIFTKEFTKQERKKIHNKAQRYGFKSGSRGPRTGRQLVISRKFKAQELFRILSEAGGSTSKYDLIPPQN